MSLPAVLMAWGLANWKPLLSSDRDNDRKVQLWGDPWPLLLAQTQDEMDAAQLPANCEHNKERMRKEEHGT